MITIEELMTRNLHTLRESDTIGDAKNLMAEKHIHHIPILNDEGHLLGLVSHRDILAASESSLHHDENDPVDDRHLRHVMVTQLTTIEKDASLLAAATHIRESGHGCLPVVDGERLVGIITDSDFVEIAISLLEQEEKKEIAFEEDVFEDIGVEDDLSDLDIDTSAAKDWD